MSPNRLGVESGVVFAGRGRRCSFASGTRRCHVPRLPSLLLLLAAAAAVLSLLRPAGDAAFVAAGARGADVRQLRGGLARTRLSATADREWEKAMDEVLYPPELMWDKTDPEVLKDFYPGARDFWSIFWSIILPSTSAGFLIVGLSAYFGFDLVDLTPFTQQYLGFLRANQFIQWIPQGAFMTFYGFFGTFLISPVLWWLVGTNLGNGVCKFDRRAQRMQIIRDGEMVRDIPFEDIDSVNLDWTNLAVFGPREIYVMSKGEEIHFQENTIEIPKRVLERKAAQLSEFLEKELVVDDS